MKLSHLFVISSLVLSVAGCCGKGDNKPPTRWDQPTKPDDKKAPAKPDDKKPDDKKPEPPKTDDKKPEPPKAEPKPVDAGAMNKFFPADNTDGFKRVFLAEKAGQVTAEFSKGGKKLTMFINDLAGKADDRKKFDGASEKVSGYPYKTFGKGKSQVLVGDRYQVDIASQDFDEAARKPWFGKFDLSGLAKLK